MAQEITVPVNAPNVGRGTFTSVLSGVEVAQNQNFSSDLIHNPGRYGRLIAKLIMSNQDGAVALTLKFLLEDGDDWTAGTPTARTADGTYYYLVGEDAVITDTGADEVLSKSSIPSRFKLNATFGASAQITDFDVQILFADA